MNVQNFTVYIDHIGHDCDGTQTAQREEQMDEAGLHALLGRLAASHSTMRKELHTRTIEYVFGRHNGEGFETTTVAFFDPEAEPLPAYDSDSESGAHLFVMGGN